MKRALLLWLLLIAATVVFLARSEAWRPSPPVLPDGKRVFILSEDDVRAACAEATVRIPGVNPQLLRSKPSEFFDRVRAAVGDGAANTIHSLYVAKHLSVGKDEVFFGNAQLCFHKDLPADCKARCVEAGFQ
jgi:hypothetical protein